MLRSAREQYLDTVRLALERFEKQELEWRASERREREQFLARRLGTSNFDLIDFPHIEPRNTPQLAAE
jgi:hypothetical protein